MHDWAYMQPIKLQFRPAIAATLLSAALAPWKAQASSSGLNNIPTADTAPHLTSYEPANTLVSDRYYDTLSGQQAYKCFACRFRKDDRQG